MVVTYRIGQVPTLYIQNNAGLKKKKKKKPLVNVTSTL